MFWPFKCFQKKILIIKNNLNLILMFNYIHTCSSILQLYSVSSCNIKKWPRWKMIPRVIFQRLKWLPGSFFNEKSWDGSKFNIKFWTKGREKVTPSMKFWPPGGGGVSFFNDFSTLKNNLYTPANEVVEVFWFHYGCLSVCLSVHMFVRLWKSGFCTITPLSFDIQWWYFTHMLTLTWGGPLMILDQKIKGQI